MDVSLSIVLPVHNAQRTLQHDVHLLLELLSDVTPYFEVLIVDDASTDQTDEIAHELSVQYPQVIVTRHQGRKGQAAAVQTALARTTGDVVLVQDEDAEIRSQEIRRLWEMRHDQHLVMARAEVPRKTLSPHLLEKLANWGEQLRDKQATTEQSGIQMIRREAIEDLSQLDPSHNVHFCQVPGPNFWPSTSEV